MEILLARQIVATIPQDKAPILAAAHARYMYFAGAYAANSNEEIARASEDRTRFAHLLKFLDHGRVIVSNERCAEFMATITGFPLEWCLAWDEEEFIETHGDDIDNQQIRIAVSAQTSA